MDLPIYLPTKKVFVQTFFWKKYDYNLDICPKFYSFFYWTLSLPNIPYSVTNSY